MSQGQPLPPRKNTIPSAGPHFVEIEGDNGPELVPVEVAQVEALFRIADALEVLASAVPVPAAAPVVEG